MIDFGVLEAPNLAVRSATGVCSGGGAPRNLRRCGIRARSRCAASLVRSGYRVMGETAITGDEGVSTTGAKPPRAERTLRLLTAPWLAAIILMLYTTELAIAEGDGGGSSGGGAGAAAGGGAGASAGGGAGAAAGGGGGAGGGVNPGRIFSDAPAGTVGLDAHAARRAEALGEAKSLSSILRHLSHVAQGRVLSVTFEKSIYGYDYAFTVLTQDGRYLEVVLDAKSGRLISARTR